MAKQVVAMFDDARAAHLAVRALLDLGLKRDDLGVIAHDAAGVDVEASREQARELLRMQQDAGNAVLGGMTGAFVGLGLATVPVIGPILAIGPYALAAIGAGIGEHFEGWLGALTQFGIPPDDAHVYAEGIRRGGIVVTARAHQDYVQRVVAILSRGAVDIGLREAEWRAGGWQGFDPNAAPYTPEEIRAERASRMPVPIPPARESLPPDAPSRPSMPM
jgi:hypothetical protein